MPDGSLHEFPDEATPEQMQAALTPMSTGQKWGQTALGAAKEVGKQVAGFAKGVGQNFKDLVDPSFKPKAEGLKALASSATEAVTHPAQAFQKGTEALGEFEHKVIDEPTTPQQAQERGVAVVQGAEALLPAGGVVRDVASLAARPIERALAPAAEKIAARGEAKTAVRAAEQAPINTAIEKARKANYKLPPSQAGGPTGKVLEVPAGKIQTEMKLSRDNAVNTNKIAAREIGLTERQPMTEANIERLKQKEFQVYDRVKKSGRIVADDAFKKELAATMERTEGVALDYPEDFNERVQKEITKFDKPSADASSMLDRIKSLRQRAGRNMASLSNDDFELGLAQKKIATAMENQIERSVATTDPTLIQEFRAARQKLAKIYNVEEALGPSGNVTAAVLSRQLKRGVPLSDGLKAIAETYQEFPKVMRSVEGLGGHAPLSALDYLVGGVAAVADPGAAGRIVGAMVGRPVARGIISSKAYQSVAIKPRAPKSGLLTRAARGIADAGKPAAQTLASVAPKKIKPKIRPKTRAPTLEDERRQAGE